MWKLWQHMQVQVSGFRSCHNATSSVIYRVSTFTVRKFTETVAAIKSLEQQSSWCSYLCTVHSCTEKIWVNFTKLQRFCLRTCNVASLRRLCTLLSQNYNSLASHIAVRQGTAPHAIWSTRHRMTGHPSNLAWHRAGGGRLKKKLAGNRSSASVALFCLVAPTENAARAPSNWFGIRVGIYKSLSRWWYEVKWHGFIIYTYIVLCE